MSDWNCYQGISCLRQCEIPIEQQQYGMDSPSTIPISAPNFSPGSIDENPRVKFLCSFLGSVMPRPQDGKLRYVGGETRIVSMPRDVTYEELMSKMRELYEDAAVLKYQQPDEDIDALVSVVNNDDVINMMEEYDKLGSSEGFTRLRIFLFPHPDYDGSSVFVEGDERESERRYVDALNNLNDVADFRRQLIDSSVISHIDDIHGMDQFCNPVSPCGSLPRSSELFPQYNLRHLKIPHVGLGQNQQSVSQRYNEMEAPSSPVYYSPRHHGHTDSRLVGEYPSSPGWYRMQFPDKYFDRVPEEYARQQLNHQPTCEHQPQFAENVVCYPSGVITDEKSGFPGNILHRQNVMDGIHGNSVCEHCRMNFHRNQPYTEHASMMNGLPQVHNLCGECLPYREASMINSDAKLHHGIFPSEHNNDHRSVLNFPSGTNVYHGSPNFHQQTGPELGNEVFHDQGVPAMPHVQTPPHDERGVLYGNLPYAYDSHYPPVSHGHVPSTAFRQNIQNPIHVPPPYDVSNPHQEVNGTVNIGYVRGPQEGSPRFCIHPDSQSTWVDPSQRILGLDGATTPEYSYGHASKMNPDTLGQEKQYLLTQGHIQPPPERQNFASPGPLMIPSPSSLTIDGRLVSSVHPVQNPLSETDSNVTKMLLFKSENMVVEGKEAGHVEKADTSNVQAVSLPEENQLAYSNSEVAPPKSFNRNCLNSPVENGGVLSPAENLCAPAEESKLSSNRLSLLPQLIASVKRAALEDSEDMKGVVEEITLEEPVTIVKEETKNEIVSVNAQEESELEIDDDHLKPSKIEPTKAEEEAISRGLQTIKNDDLEEIRELGSGTYGAVYHGKWKGSDVAIKRIKASCFSGRPSERERLIADFWKEALILSSLHHPNVVSFYGIVRDGPDGSLATVTEFMVNGSLKQFLRKKDRTIDRRKRLIIAMDAAFGMEYLHGKNIVHFDLKCENLLVNMRDPQRPVCKIGDLGLSKVRQHTLVSGGVRGTLPWMAPELLSGKSNMVTEKIDVYSFGIVMWEVLTGDEPYADMHCASIIGGIVNNTLRPETPTWCDPEWKALMESCWDSDPSKRPSFAEIPQKLRNMAAAMNLK